MRRTILLLLLLTAGCRGEEKTDEPQQQTSSPAVEVFAGQGRDRLCLADNGQRAGLITYAASGDANCSVRGRLLPDGTIAPDGDELCRIPVVRSDGKVSLGEVRPECAYYCGPAASLAGKTFVRMEKGGDAVDLAGDPLC